MAGCVGVRHVGMPELRVAVREGTMLETQSGWHSTVQKRTAEAKSERHSTLLRGG